MELRKLSGGGSAEPSGLKLKIKTSKKGTFYVARTSLKRDEEGNPVLENGKKVFEDRYVCQFDPKMVKVIDLDDKNKEILVRKDLELRFEVVELKVRHVVGTDWEEWRKANPDRANGQTQAGTGKPDSNPAPEKEEDEKEHAQGDGSTPY